MKGAIKRTKLRATQDMKYKISFNRKRLQKDACNMWRGGWTQWSSEMSIVSSVSAGFSPPFRFPICASGCIEVTQKDQGISHWDPHGVHLHVELGSECGLRFNLFQYVFLSLPTKENIFRRRITMVLLKRLFPLARFNFVVLFFTLATRDGRVFRSGFSNGKNVT